MDRKKRIEPLRRAVMTWKNIGIVPLFAAGNNGPKPMTILKPAVFEDSITIGSTDGDDKIARFSSQGPGVYFGRKTEKPDLTAPGVSVYSSDLKAVSTALKVVLQWQHRMSPESLQSC